MARASFSNYFKSGQKAYDWSDDDWGDFNDSVWTPEAKTPAVNVNVNGSTAYNADHSTRTDVQQNQIDNPNSPGDLAANVQNLVGSNVPTPSSVDDKSNVLTEAYNKEQANQAQVQNDQTIDNMVMSNEDSQAQFNESNDTAVMGNPQGIHGATTPDGSDPNDPDFMNDQRKKAKWNEFKGKAAGVVPGALGMVGKAFDKLTDWNQDGKRFGTATPGIEGVQGGQGIQDIVGGIQNRIDNPQSKANVAANAPTTLPDGSKAANPDPDASFGGSATDWAENRETPDMINLGNTSGNPQIRRDKPTVHAPQKVEGQEMEKEGVLSKAWNKFKQGRNDKKVKEWQQGEGAGQNAQVNQKAALGDEEFNEQSDANEPSNVWSEAGSGKSNDPYVNTGVDTSYDPKKEAFDKWMNPGMDSERWESMTDYQKKHWQEGKIKEQTKKGNFLTPGQTDEDPNLPQDTVDNPAAHISQGKISREDYQGQIEQRDKITTPITDAYNNSSNTVKQLQGLKGISKKLEDTSYDFNSVPDSIIDSITQVESGGASADSLAASFKSEGAVGPMQQRKIFQDEIARLDPSMKGYDPNDPEQARKAAKIYIAHQMKSGSDLNTAIRSYNAGRGGAKKGLGGDYLNKVLKAYEQNETDYMNPQGYKPTVANESQDNDIFLKPVEEAWSNTMFTKGDYK